MTMPESANYLNAGATVRADNATAPAPAPAPALAATARGDARIGYRPEIDGLRAFAVVPVILFHLGIQGFHGGSLGVDVFFVISGFLITSIVKREADAGTFSFAKFWARRIRRIMPAMLVVTIASLLFAIFFVYRPDQPAIFRQSAWSLLSAANLYFWKFVGDYWGLAASQSPFLHMWSLAVEEQFYLFVPPAVWLIYKFAPRHLLTCVLLVLAGSLAVFLVGIKKNPDATFYLLPTRAWELAAGCALAVIGVRKQGGWQAALGAAGLAMVVASYFLVGAEVVSAGMILPVLGTVLVIAYARTGPSFYVLANPVAVYTGKLSYSLYLWHWPVIVFPKYMDQHVPIWASLALMTVLSMLSYYLVETPTRHARGVVPWVLGVLAVTTAAAIGMATIHRPYDTRAFETPQLTLRYYDCNPTAPPIDKTWASMNLLPAAEGMTKTSFAEGGLRSGAGTPQVVVLGDSHATFWAPAVRTATDKLAVPTSFWVMSGVNPFFSVPPKKQKTPWYISADDVLQYDAARIKLIEAWKPRVVIVAARWSVKWQKEMQPFIDHLAQHAGQVLLIEQPPELPIGNRNALDYLCYKGYAPRDGTRQYYEAVNRDAVERGRAMLGTVAATHANISVVPTFDLYAQDATTCVLDGRQVVYMDDDHLTAYGASMAAGRIEQAISDALGTPSVQPQAK